MITNTRRLSLFFVGLLGFQAGFIGLVYRLGGPIRPEEPNAVGPLLANGILLAFGLVIASRVWKGHWLVPALIFTVFLTLCAGVIFVFLMRPITPVEFHSLRYYSPVYLIWSLVVLGSIVWKINNNHKK